MFAVIFEALPRPDQWDAYLGHAQRLRPELERIDGFVDNLRYRSLSRAGWVLSLSTWRDEKSLVRWRTHAAHHEVQAKGRGEVLADYHLRVGQLTRDTAPPPGAALREQRLDETEVGSGTTLILLEARGVARASDAAACADALGLDRAAPGLVAWDTFDAVLTPGDAIALATWRDESSALDFERQRPLPDGVRLRRVRVVRDYGLADRREAPQYHRPAG